jgi:hypothetical protein
VAYRVVIPDEVGASMARFSPELFGRIRRHLAGLAELAELLVRSPPTGTGSRTNSSR